MSLFKKKKPVSNIVRMLEIVREQSLALNKTVFYYPLNDDELEIAQQWAKDNHLIITLSHQDEYHLVYKFSQA